MPAVQEHALNRYMLACPLQARATCPGTWWTRLTHPEQPPMPPPTHRHQNLILVLVPVLNTPGLWLCGSSSEGPRSLRGIRVRHRSQPGQASMGTGSVRARSESRLKVPSLAPEKRATVQLTPASMTGTSQSRSHLQRCMMVPRHCPVRRSASGDTGDESRAPPRRAPGLCLMPKVAVRDR